MDGLCVNTIYHTLLLSPPHGDRIIIISLYYHHHPTVILLHCNAVICAIFAVHILCNFRCYILNLVNPQLVAIW